MSNDPIALSVRAALAGALTVVTPGLQAAAFQVAELSVAGIGLANAMVANPTDLGAIAYNAAAMGFQTQSALTAATLFIFPDDKVTTASGTHEGQGEDAIFVPALQAMLKINSDWSLGFNVNSQFGLETYWEIGTFPALSQAIPTGLPGISLPAGTFHPTQTKMEVINFTPTLAYRINPNLSASAGFDYYDLRKMGFDTGAVEISSKNGDGFGWNLGLMYNNGPLTLGASYHSSATLEGHGTLSTSSPILAAVGLGTQSVDGEVPLPWRLQLGARYAFNDQLAVELDMSRTGWSSFDTVEFKSSATGQTILSSDNYWKDSNAYKVGLSYNLTANTQLRLGYSYDETCENDLFFSGRVPDDNRHLYSVGLAHRLPDGWEVEAAYMHVQFDDRDYQASKTFDPSTSTDPNGTTALNGQYELTVDFVGVGVSKRF